MPGGRPSAFVIGVVFFGSLLLLVPLSFFATTRTIAVLGGLLGVADPVRTPIGRIASLVSIAVGFKVASDIASIRVAGSAAIERGPPGSRLLSRCLMSWVTVASGVFAADVAYDLLAWGVANGRVEVIGLAVLLVGALLWAIGRSWRAFLRGYRG